MNVLRLVEAYQRANVEVLKLAIAHHPAGLKVLNLAIAHYRAGINMNMTTMESNTRGPIMRIENG